MHANGHSYGPPARELRLPGRANQNGSPAINVWSIFKAGTGLNSGTMCPAPLIVRKVKLFPGVSVA
jgi:hypothetical protein